MLILAATNRPPQDEIAQGRLRKDFFRIGVIEIAVPSLRERKEDLPLLLEYLLEQYCPSEAGADSRQSASGLAE